MKVKLKKWFISTSKRRLYMLLKVFIIIVMFGIYVAILMKESMSVIEQTKNQQHQQLKQQQHNGPTSNNDNKNSHNYDVKTGNNKIIVPKKHHRHHSSNNKKQHSASETKVVVPVAAASSTLNPIYEYSEELNAAAEQDFNERRQTLQEACVKWKLVDKYPVNSWEFFISPGHGLAWCNIFKAASSAWMYYFNILGGYNLQYLQRTKASPIELARKRFPRPSQPELIEALSSSVSFLIVREPFERLLSAYRNKLEGCRNKYYKLLGEQIVRKFRRDKNNKPINNKKAHKLSKHSGPTFKEFLQFLVHHYKTGGRFDEHWSPIYTFCTPCSINLTLIAKTETFQRDTEYIIRQAGLESLLLDKMPKKSVKVKTIANRATNGDTKSLIPKYFAQIDENLLREILEIYEPDFELFGYNSTKYFDLVQSQAELNVFVDTNQHLMVENSTVK
ncbi:carbohydrate sulfotransferase 11 [Culicoides brevitarsis]|uniref:carbohydrate sulfotransferase 11 n=1 Tax=Culicoides brevitarsis TaxID=469753 RepID=UPI00307BA923